MPDAAEKSSLIDRSFSQICALIADGRLAPGEPVTHRGIAAECGISTVPVAAAFRKLEAMGIIVTRPGRGGSHIALIGADELWDSVQLRLAIEQRALLLAAESATSDEIEALHGAAELAENRNGASGGEHFQHEFAFHSSIIRCAHSPLLLRQSWVLFDYQLKARLCPELRVLPASSGDTASGGGTGHILLTKMLAGRDPRLSQMLEAHVISSLRHPKYEAKIRAAREFLDRID